jgi:hypothetical protein
LEEVSAAVVAAVEAHRVHAVQAPHAVRQLRLRRLDQNVEVVVEQVPDVNLPAEALLDFEKQLVPGLAIEVIEDDRPLLDAAADHVVPGGAGQLRPWYPRHAKDGSPPSPRAKPSEPATSQGQSLGHVPRGDSFFVDRLGKPLEADCG